MKKRTLCLLLAGMMTLSVLSGCGGQPTGGQPNTPDNSPADTPAAGNDNVPNNEAPMVPDDNDWEYWDSVADAMEHEGQNQGQDQPENNLPFPRDPRWDELQPGETAAQYYDIFIKSGMTLGEVVEAVESSDVYNDQFITWEINKDNKLKYHGDYSNPDNVLEVGSTFDATHKVLSLELGGALTEKGVGTVPTGNAVDIKCDGRTVISARFFGVLPGAADETYRVGDLPVFLVNPGGNNDSVLTSVGMYGDLLATDKDTVEGLLDVFKAWNPDTEMTSERKSYDSNSNFTEYKFYSYIPIPSWNGYSLWCMPKGENSVKGVLPVYSLFQIDAATGELRGHIINAVGAKDGYTLYWSADDAG